MKKYNLNEIIIDLIFSITFFAIAVQKTIFTSPFGDGAEYKLIYDNIDKNPTPFQIEVTLPLLMQLGDFLGLDYQTFALIKQCIWIPIILASKQRFCKNNNVKSLIFLAPFLSPALQGATIELSRQALALQLFLIIIIAKRSFTYPLVLAMLLTHTSSIIWIISTYKKLARLSISKSLYAISLITLAAKLDIPKLLIEFAINIGNIMGNSGENLLIKASFYTDSHNIDQNNIIITVVVITAPVFILLIKKNLTDYQLKFFSLAFTSSLLYIATIQNPILSNRLGFFSYFFALQILGAITYTFFTRNEKN